MMQLATKGPFRDASGRFRAKTRDDMSLFERINFDAFCRLANSLGVDHLTFDDSVQYTGRTVRTTLRILLPSDFKIIDRNRLVD